MRSLAAFFAAISLSIIGNIISTVDDFSVILFLYTFPLFLIAGTLTDAGLKKNPAGAPAVYSRCLDFGRQRCGVHAEYSLCKAGGNPPFNRLGGGQCPALCIRAARDQASEPLPERKWWINNEKCRGTCGAFLVCCRVSGVFELRRAFYRREQHRWTVSADKPERFSF